MPHERPHRGRLVDLPEASWLHASFCQTGDNDFRWHSQHSCWVVFSFACEFVSNCLQNCLFSLYACSVWQHRPVCSTLVLTQPLNQSRSFTARIYIKSATHNYTVSMREYAANLPDPPLLVGEQESPYWHPLCIYNVTFVFHTPQSLLLCEQLVALPRA